MSLPICWLAIRKPVPEISRIVTVCNQKGLHARAAAKFVKTAESYDAEIWVSKLAAEEDTMAKVTARSILGLMMLAAEKDSQLAICAQGVQAQEALDALETLVSNRFGEEA
jgi:phosphocarrier protein HPr